MFFLLFLFPDSSSLKECWPERSVLVTLQLEMARALQNKSSALTLILNRNDSSHSWAPQLCWLVGNLSYQKSMEVSVHSCNWNFYHHHCRRKTFIWLCRSNKVFYLCASKPLKILLGYISRELIETLKQEKCLWVKQKPSWLSWTKILYCFW